MSNSTSTVRDVITNADFDHDKFLVGAINGTVTGVDNAVTTGARSSGAFDSNLAGGAGQLAGHHAVLFTADAGDLSGHTL